MSWDVIVVGAGGVGSAVLSALARRGASVLGIDRFNPPHDRGSTHGDTRVIRLAYFEHPHYVPLLRAAYEGWERLEAATGQSLYVERGVVEAGPDDGVVVPGVMASAALHGLEVEKLSAAEARARFPSLIVPDSMSAVVEQRAGFLWVERCVEAALGEARAAGAQLEPDTEVLAIGRDGSGWCVKTSRGDRRAARIVVAPGAWAQGLLGELGLRFEVRRKSLFWLDAPDDGEAPVFLFETPGGVYYGFPPVGGAGLKVAEHSGGHVLKDPLLVDRRVDLGEQDRVLAFAREYLSVGARPVNRHATCLYTMTPDEHFIVDRHPDQLGLVLIAGLSGHGFKFATVLGEIAADLTLNGQTAHPIEFLSVRRPGLR